MIVDCNNEEGNVRGFLDYPGHNALGVDTRTLINVLQNVIDVSLT